MMERRSFLKSLFFAGATAIIAPTKLVQVAVGFNTKSDGTIEHRGSALTRAEARLLNEILFERLSSCDPVREKEAIDAVNDYTRMKMRQEGFYRRILPPLKIENDELDRSDMSRLPRPNTAIWFDELRDYDEVVSSLLLGYPVQHPYRSPPVYTPEPGPLYQFPFIGDQS